MLGNGIVSVPSLHRKAALAAIIVLTLMLTGVAAVLSTHPLLTAALLGASVGALSTPGVGWGAIKVSYSPSATRLYALSRSIRVLSKSNRIAFGLIAIGVP